MMQKYRKHILIGLGFLIVFSVYLFFFFQSGIVINETFMPKKTEDGRTLYTSGDTTIRVQKSNNVCSIVLMETNSFTTYIVTVEDNKEYYKKITIYQNDNEVFSGLYDSGGSSNFRLFEKDGTPYFGEEQEDGLNLMQLVSIYSEDITIRGEPAPLLLALIILILWAIDICFPRALFWLSHFISVQNPEPSDFYLVTQRISWVALPILAVILLIFGLV